MSQPFLFSLIDKAVFDYTMIENGDRILLGASGGKDSTSLVEYLALRSLRPDCGFRFTALHLHTEITPPLTPRQLSLFRSWGVEPVEVESGVLSRLKKGHKMNCWWCATQRRTELIKYALSHNYNKLALGHHQDDILETLLMNVLALSSLWTLIPVAVALVITVIRTALEDRTLQEELPGYRDYTRRVRYRLIPWIY